MRGGGGTDPVAALVLSDHPDCLVWLLILAFLHLLRGMNVVGSSGALKWLYDNQMFISAGANGQHHHHLHQFIWVSHEDQSVCCAIVPRQRRDTDRRRSSIWSPSRFQVERNCYTAANKFSARHSSKMCPKTWLFLIQSMFLAHCLIEKYLSLGVKRSDYPPHCFWTPPNDIFNTQGPK